jgi:hypothetical protein
MKQNRYVLRPPITGPCSASPVHSSLGRDASNRPNTRGPSPPSAGRFSSSRPNSRCSVRSDGAQPEAERKIRCTCAAVRSGFSRFSAAARSSTSPGVLGLACRGAGTSASNPPSR